jgi:hypothetical protein
MSSWDPDNLCDISGVCCAPYGEEAGVTNCVHCGKELVKVNGQWFTWDYEYHPHPLPQSQEGKPL